MKKLLIIASLMLMTACADIQKEREGYIAGRPGMTEEIANAIRNGKVRRGMTKDDVANSIGWPCGRCPGTRSNSWGDTWEYNMFGTGSYSHGNGNYIFFDKTGKVKGWSQ